MAPQQEARPARPAAAGTASKARAPAKAAPGMSPRSKTLINELRTVLEPYNYGEAEISALVRRCGYDQNRIQDAVVQILEDRAGHEHDDWSQKATSSDRKQKAQEAKERRLEREEQEAAELKAIMAQRAEAEERRTREIASRRQFEAAEKKRQATAPRGGEAASRAGAAARAWRPAGEDEPAAEPADPAAEASVQEEKPPEEPQASEDHEEDGREQAGAWQPPEPGLPPEEASASLPSAPPRAALQRAEAPLWPPDAAPWADDLAGEAPASAAHHPGASPDCGAAPDSPSIVMPPSWDIIFGDGPEPVMRFGTMGVPSPRTAAAPVHVEPLQEEVQPTRDQRWAPRGEAQQSNSDSRPSGGGRGRGRGGDRRPRGEGAAAEGGPGRGGGATAAGEGKDPDAKGRGGKGKGERRGKGKGKGDKGDKTSGYAGRGGDRHRSGGTWQPSGHREEAK